MQMKKSSIKLLSQKMLVKILVKLTQKPILIYFFLRKQRFFCLFALKLDHSKVNAFLLYLTNTQA